MHLLRLFRTLRTDLSSQRHQPHYALARQRHASLREHLDIHSVLRALSVTGSASTPSGDALVRTLVYEYHARYTVLWASALLVAFRPALLNIRRSIATTALASEELDQLVLCGFLEALERRPTRSARVSACLRGDTFRYIVRLLSADQRRFSRLQRLAGDGSTYPASALGASHAQVEQSLDLRKAFDRLLQRKVPACRLEAVVATQVEDEPLRAYVARSVGPQSDVEFDRALARIRRERLRTLGHLRTLLLPELPPDGANSP